jgi:two-component system chemotaxis sensor kinase CheA
MDDLINEFISETVESLSELDVDLVKLEQNPEDQELLGKIFRLMHTIKGTCGFLGLPRLEKVAHAAENLLDLFRSGEMGVSQDSMTALFKSIDRVRFLVDEIEERGTEPEGDDQDVIAQIEEQVTIGTGAPVSHDDVELESLFEDKRSDKAKLSVVGGAEEDEKGVETAGFTDEDAASAAQEAVVVAKTPAQDTKASGIARCGRQNA